MRSVESGKVSLPCCCEEPKKVYSKAGCYACWSCSTCGRFGGCENSTAIMELASKYNAWSPELLLVEAKPEPECEHCYHLVEDGEVMTSHPCWWQVMCCKCGHSDHMRTDLWTCRYRVKSKLTGREVQLGPKLTGKLYRGDK